MRSDGLSDKRIDNAFMEATGYNAWDAFQTFGERFSLDEAKKLKGKRLPPLSPDPVSFEAKGLLDPYGKRRRTGASQAELDAEFEQHRKTKGSYTGADPFENEMEFPDEQPGTINNVQPADAANAIQKQFYKYLKVVGEYRKKPLLLAEDFAAIYRPLAALGTVPAAPFMFQPGDPEEDSIIDRGLKWGGGIIAAPFGMTLGAAQAAHASALQSGHNIQDIGNPGEPLPLPTLVPAPEQYHAQMKERAKALGGENNILIAMHDQEEELQKKLGQSFGENLAEDATDIQLGVKMMVGMALNTEETGEEGGSWTQAVAADFEKYRQAGQAFFAGAIGGTLQTLLTVGNSPDGAVKVFQTRPLSTLMEVVPLGKALGNMAKTNPKAAALLADPRVQKAMHWGEVVSQRAGLGVAITGDFVGAVVGGMTAISDTWRALPPGAQKTLTDAFAKLNLDKTEIGQKMVRVKEWITEEAKALGVPEDEFVRQLALEPGKIRSAIMATGKAATAEVAKGKAKVAPGKKAKAPIVPDHEIGADVIVQVKKGPTGKKRKDGSPVNAYYNRRTKTVHIDEKAIGDQYVEKKWKKPEVPGVNPLPDGVIRSKEDWIEFNLRHEFAHATEPWRKKGPYDRKKASKREAELQDEILDLEKRRKQFIDDIKKTGSPGKAKLDLSHVQPTKEPIGGPGSRTVLSSSESSSNRRVGELAMERESVRGSLGGKSRLNVVDGRSQKTVRTAGGGRELVSALKSRLEGIDAKMRERILAPFDKAVKREVAGTAPKATPKVFPQLRIKEIRGLLEDVMSDELPRVGPARRKLRRIFDRDIGVDEAVNFIRDKDGLFKAYQAGQRAIEKRRMIDEINKAFDAEISRLAEEKYRVRRGLRDVESAADYENRMNEVAMRKMLADRGEELVQSVDPVTGDIKRVVRAMPGDRRLKYGTRPAGERQLVEVNSYGEIQSTQADKAPIRNPSPERKEPSVATSPQVKAFIDGLHKDLSDRLPLLKGRLSKEGVGAAFVDALMDDSLALLKGRRFRGLVANSIGQRLGLKGKAVKKLFDQLDETLFQVATDGWKEGGFRSIDIKVGNKTLRLEDAVMDVVLGMKKQGQTKPHLLKKLREARGRAFDAVVTGFAEKAERAAHVLLAEKEARRWGGKLELDQVAPAVAKMLDEGKELPHFLAHDPKSVAAQLRKMGRNKDADALLKRYQPISFVFDDDLLDAAKEMSGGEYHKWRPGTMWATKAANRAVGAQLEFVSTFQRSTDMATTLERFFKRNIVTRNPRSHNNNFTSNYMMQALRRGDPLVLKKVWSAARRWKRYTDGLIDPNSADGRMFDALARTGFVDTSLLEGELGALHSGAMLTKAADAVTGNRKVREAALLGRKALSWMDEGYKYGDTPFRVEESVRQWKRLTSDLAKHEVGDRARLTLDRGKKIELVRQKDGWYANGKKLSDKQLDDIKAKASTQSAQNLFFDYTDLPTWMKKLKSSKGSMLASPFMIWLWKSLDVPGFKKGLGARMVESTGILESTSKAVNQRLAKENAALAMRRAVMYQSLHGMLSRDRDAVAAIHRNGGDDQSLILEDLATNPLYTQAKHFYSGDLFEMTRAGWNASQSLIVAASRIPDVKPPEGYSDEGVPLTEPKYDKKELRRWAKHKGGGYATMDTVFQLTSTQGALIVQAFKDVDGMSFEEVKKYLESNKSKGVKQMVMSAAGYSAYLTIKKAVGQDETGESWGRFVADQFIGAGLKDAIMRNKVNEYLGRVERNMNASTSRLYDWRLKQLKKDASLTQEQKDKKAKALMEERDKAAMAMKAAMDEQRARMAKFVRKREGKPLPPIQDQVRDQASKLLGQSYD